MQKFNKKIKHCRVKSAQKSKGILAHGNGTAHGKKFRDPAVAGHSVSNNLFGCARYVIQVTGCRQDACATSYSTAGISSNE